MSVFIRQVNLIQLVDDIKEKKKKTGSPKKEENVPTDCLQTQAAISCLSMGLQPAGFGIAHLQSLYSLSHVHTHTPKSCTPFSLCGPQACSFFVGSSFSGFQNASVPRIMS